MVLVALSLFIISNSRFHKLLAQDTIFPFGMITPFEIKGNAEANFPIQYPDFINDINGDGFGDFAINRWSADERTDQPLDVVAKSVVITDIHHPDSCQVFYGTVFKGIQDFNGDGFDDVLDIWNMVIYFGSPGGLSYDTMHLDYPFKQSNSTLLYYAGDISNDGKSELLISETYELDSVYVYSGTPQFEVLIVNPLLLFKENISIFKYYDYDNDGVKELAVCGQNINYLYEDYRVNWYNFDTIQHNLVFEKAANVIMNQKPYPNFTNAFADVNGDNIPDITHAFALTQVGFGLEVCFGQEGSPYFSSPVDIMLGNISRLFYMGGDLNNDGAEDWYTVTYEDSVTLFYGNPNVAEQGFTRQNFYTGQAQRMFPMGKYFDYNLCSEVPVIYYDKDEHPDMLFNYWTVDENRRFDTTGCCIVRGGDSLDFFHPFVMGRKTEDSYPELQYGYKTKTLEDLNNDGIKDWGTLALTGCYADIFFSDVYFHTEPDIRILLPQLTRAECYDWSSGDLNGDGFTDLAIANSSDEEVIFSDGIYDPVNKVYVFFGSHEWPAVLNYQDADVILQDTSYFYEFGKSVGIVGDYNTDGYDDLVIGGTRYSDSIRMVYLYYGGNTISAQPDLIIQEPCQSGNFYFGDPVTVCGDINHDNYEDFALADPYGDGRSLIYFGGPYYADEHYDAQLTNPFLSRTYYGNKTMAQTGDFDGDGFPDMVQSAYYPVDGIFFYKGGPDFDTIVDYSISDTTINYVGLLMDCAEGFTHKGKADLFINIYNNPLTALYSVEESGECPVNYYFKNEYNTVYNIASGDFDHDGYSEICTGNNMEPNYGNRYGGVIQLYRSPVMTGSPDMVPSENDEFNIYPNPANDHVTIGLPSSTTGNVNISISDLDGKIHVEKKFLKMKNSEELIVLNIKTMTSGVYVLHLDSPRASGSKKLVIVR
jgi:hypothetical protein